MHSRGVVNVSDLLYGITLCVAGLRQGEESRSSSFSTETADVSTGEGLIRPHCSNTSYLCGLRDVTSTGDAP